MKIQQNMYINYFILIQEKNDNIYISKFIFLPDILKNYYFTYIYRSTIDNNFYLLWLISKNDKNSQKQIHEG